MASHHPPFRTPGALRAGVLRARARRAVLGLLVPRAPRPDGKGSRA
ncbi:hypothetical protein GCM10010218_52610 [Streptomyces mashuensis]|uniref:Uncharacterized protein n=1 Tax=Streptomyces mashuensis TaxID=33904 RepID=A0A919B7N3_9ACTN|nr:hypothetical protein [Streptomyces mashuensis]GHF64516.1 hypothetical protein GCM10010218_52610 [Streptomyces mashuensis]